MPICLKKNTFFFVFFNKDYNFCTKNIFICPKNCVQIIFYNETCKEFRKTQFFSNIFTFLSVICQNFEDILRILGNFGKFSCKHSKIYRFRPYVFQKLHFFGSFFLNEDYSFFTLKIYSFGPNYAFKSFFTTKNTKSFVRINFLVTFLHF